MESEQKVLRIGICGARAVGKTNLCKRLTDKELDIGYISTIGADLMVRELPDKGVKLYFWDLAGHGRFDSITCSYINTVNFILFVYNIEDHKSVKRLYRLNKLYSRVSRVPPAIVVGTHSDTLNVRFNEEGKEFAADIDSPHLLVSTKTGEGIAELLAKIIDMLVPQPTPEQSPPSKTTWMGMVHSKCLIL